MEDKDSLDRDFVTTGSNEFISVRATKLPDVPSLAWEKEWKGWTEYLTGSTEVYDKMCCDCRRAAPVGGHFTCHYWELQKENRFYYNKERDTRAVFYFMHGDADAFGLAHTFEGCNAVKMAANINTVLADDPKREPAWKGNPNGLVQSLLANNVNLLH
ncbi:hypothetical protein DIPPA_30875 [Diplonema papillatum]|nr:hypothetical protein DIPPA_30875 [Diplonema papillatum]